MIARFYLLLLINFLFSINLIAQDKLLFLNGKELKGTIIEKTNYEFTIKNKNDKKFIIDKYRVFSFTQNNQENIVYEFDTLSGNFLKVKDMKLFVYGEREAHKHFKPRFTSAMGLAVGGAAGYFMHKDNAFIYITTPLIYTIGTLVFPTRVNRKKLTDKKFLNDDEYLRGHERIARSKRTQCAIKTSIFSMGVGFLVSFLVNSDDQ